MDIVIRDAVPEDVPLILGMIKELAAFEWQPDAVVATEADLLRDGWGPNPRFSCRMALLDGEVCGFTLWFFNYSTWRGRAGIHVEDFYITPSARGRGVGQAMIRDLAALAVRHGATRLDLNVLQSNPARQFYERLGITHLVEWLPYRLTGDALQRLGTPKT